MDLKILTNEELIQELVRRGAELANTSIYGEYKLTKKYSSDRREVFSQILILNGLSGS